MKMTVGFVSIVHGAMTYGFESKKIILDLVQHMHLHEYDDVGTWSGQHLRREKVSRRIIILIFRNPIPTTIPRPYIFCQWCKIPCRISKCPNWQFAIGALASPSAIYSTRHCAVIIFQYFWSIRSSKNRFIPSRNTKWFWRFNESCKELYLNAALMTSVD